MKPRTETLENAEHPHAALAMFYVIVGIATAWLILRRAMPYLIAAGVIGGVAYTWPAVKPILTVVAYGYGAAVVLLIVFGIIGYIVPNRFVEQNMDWEEILEP